MKVVKAGNTSYDLFHFEWTLVNWCNFKCVYCSSKDFMVDKWAKNNSISNYKLTLSRLKNFNSDFHIELYGGEPSLHPNINEIIKGLTTIEHCKKIEIITNLSKPLKFWQELPKELKICASYHVDFTDDDFITKIENIKKTHYIRVTVNLVDDETQWNKILTLIEQLKLIDVEYNLHFLNNTSTWKSNYNSNFFKTFKPLERNLYEKKVIELYKYQFEDGEKELQDLEIYENGLHRFNGYKCNPRFYSIQFDGSIKNMCTRKPMNKLLFDESDLNVTEICPNQQCACEVMFNFPKELV